MKRQLARNRAGHASGRRFNRREGRADDPDALVAEEDINRLLDDLARLKERVFDLGFYLLLRASNREALSERLERLYSVLGLLSIDATAHPATFEQVEVLQSCLPQARDDLLRTFTLDSTTLASMFPFLSNSLMMPGGALVGVSETHEPVLLNPWDATLENPHLFIGGVTGSGKSYLGKLLVERDLLLNWQRGDQCFVIDPDLEYHQLAEALGGTVVRLAPGSAQRLNPFDLLPPRCDFRTYLVEASKGDRLAEKIQDLHAMLDIILAEDATASSSGGGMLTKREKGLLDRALYETYRRVGITGDPRTHHRQPPLLYQLYELLKSGLCGPDETDLSGRLYRYVSGSLSSLFSDVTSVDLASSLVVWDIRDMRSELRPLAISLIADRVWTQALYDSRRPRALYIDEAASLIEHPAGGHFLATLSRRARKRYLRLVTMTQNPEQFVQDPWGSVVASNAAIKVLKAQDATSAAAVAERFHLTRSE
jgi:type IV secretory pathway VirB4 component